MDKINTPENIIELQPNEVFVFGSNANGNHAGGAARIAVEEFGAIMGQAEGLQGQSYAIPTLDKNMQKLSLEDIKQSIITLYDFANQNAAKKFLVTKIGCGIAGFTINEIAELFKSLNKPINVILPVEFEEVKLITYKGFDSNLRCRDMRYKVGEEYELDGDIKCCKRGFHACESPMEVWDYYDMLNSRFCEVEQSGVIDKESNTTKVCSSKIKIKAELKLADIIKLGVDWLIEKTSNHKGNSGDSAKIGSSGDYAQIGSSGDYAQIGSSGDSAKIGSSGYSAKIGSSGDSAKIGSSGDSAKIGSSGYSAKIGSSGYSAKIDSTGDDSIICCAGANGMVKAKRGSWITLSEWRWDNEKNRNVPKYVKTEFVDGERIKEDTWYKLIDGEFVEVK